MFYRFLVITEQVSFQGHQYERMKLHLKSSKALFIRFGIMILALLTAGRYLWNGPGAGSSFPEYSSSNQSPPGNFISNGMPEND